MKTLLLFLPVILFEGKEKYSVNGGTIDLCPESLPRDRYLSVSGSRCYRNVTTRETYPNAQTECNKDGGFIAEVLSDDMNNYFVSLAGLNGIWIGLAFNRDVGEWIWDNGNSLNYTNWDRNQPQQNDEDCAVITSNRRWHDYPCQSSFTFICEYEFRYCNIDNCGNGTCSELPTSRYTSCTCDPGYHGQECQEVKCGIPPLVKNAVFSGTSRLYNVGESITYSCNAGYVNIANKLTETNITCTDNSMWEEIPICAAFCGPPENVENAVVSSGDVFLPGETVLYTCNDRYVIPETRATVHNITCTSNGEWQLKPTCIVTCNPPQPIQNGFFPSGSVYMQGDRVTVTCYPSYVIADTRGNHMTMTCDSDGTWNTDPVCTRECGPAPVIPNSTNNASSTEVVQGRSFRILPIRPPVFTEGDMVLYTCDSNYVMSGSLLRDKMIQCEASGHWSQIPICIVYCNTPPTIQHATKDNTGTVFIPGSAVTWTCNDGYVIQATNLNSNKVICGSDGTWTTNPVCMITCNPPQSIQNGFIPPGSVYVQGDRVTVTCDPSYVIADTKESKMTISCNSDGSWNKDPVCTRDCGSAPVIPHSTNNASNTVFTDGDVVMYTCDSNYIMSGSLLSDATIQCESSGLWSETPICLVNCNTPPSIQHATKDNSGATFIPGNVVTWTCNDGYVIQATNLNSDKVVCGSDGMWTANPVCIAYCGDHTSVDHAQVQGTGNQDGDNRTYTCDNGHTLVGSSVITCQSNSVWEDAPSCPADCGNPPILPKGFLLGSGNLENDTRNATCKDGYVLEGSSTVKCQMNGEWETLPRCAAREVFKFKESMFGAAKSTISTQTGVAMIVAILLGVLLIGIGAVYFYNLCQQKRKQGKEQRNNGVKSNDKNKTRNRSAPSDQLHNDSEFEIYSPFGDKYQGDRRWQDVFYVY